MSNKKSDTEVGHETFNELALMNKKALLCYEIVSAVLMIAYIVELTKGNRTVGYMLIFSALLLIPLVLSILYYQTHKDGKFLKSIIAVGYGILYTYVLWTSYSILSFTYVIPMLLAITVFSDAYYTLRIGIAATLVNIVYIIMNVMSGTATSEDIVAYEIQVAALVLMVGFSFISSKTMKKISDHKMELLEKEKEKQGGMLEKIVSATTNMCGMIEEIAEESKTMAAQGEGSRDAIEEIVTGTNELARTIQNQLQMTDNINQLTDATVHLVSDIQDKFNGTRKVTEQGAENMKALSKASVISKEACETVNETMGSLADKIEQMKSILSLINSVTKQTTLLSLNASIEAAHAGENGRGFAVVADEIKSLAEETAKATDKIGEIFDELENQTTIADKSVSSLMEANKKQDTLLTETTVTFESIKQDINDVSESIGTQADYMGKVSTSNGEINESVEGLSAFSEELLANIENTGPD